LTRIGESTLAGTSVGISSVDYQRTDVPAILEMLPRNDDRSSAEPVACEQPSDPRPVRQQDQDQISTICLADSSGRGTQ
jgi:hypothetical protein